MEMTKLKDLFSFYLCKIHWKRAQNKQGKWNWALWAHNTPKVKDKTLCTQSIHTVDFLTKKDN